MVREQSADSGGVRHQEEEPVGQRLTGDVSDGPVPAAFAAEGPPRRSLRPQDGVDLVTGCGVPEPGKQVLDGAQDVVGTQAGDPDAGAGGGRVVPPRPRVPRIGASAHKVVPAGASSRGSRGGRPWSLPPGRG